MLPQGIQDFFQLLEVLLGIICLGEDADVIDIYNNIARTDVFLQHR
jgi:hypothetical protein